MPVSWDRLIRFVATDGRILRGEPILPIPDFDLGQVVEGTGLKARVIQGDDIYDTTGATKVTDEIVTVKTLLGPLVPSDVPIIRCIGLNYVSYICETGRKMPNFPFMFFKPPTTVLDHGANVIIPKFAQSNQPDYEGELCIIIGKDAKNVSEEDALDYIVAYTAGNDISSRKLQRDPELAGPVPQWGFSKGFDAFAPLGPALISSRVVPDPSSLHPTTTVDGQVRQSSGLSDLLFNVPYLVSFLSNGTTLQKGSVIMTGTPGGVGSGQKPPKFLEPGTTVEVHISKIGMLKNGVEYA